MWTVVLVKIYRCRHCPRIFYWIVEISDLTHFILLKSAGKNLNMMKYSVKPEISLLRVFREVSERTLRVLTVSEDFYDL